MTTIGVVSPGAMGSAVGRAWSAGGVRAVATVAGRSDRTRRLAAGLELLPDLPAVVAAADVVVSICPPGQAESVAAEVLTVAADLGRTPLYADLNALSPDLVERLARRAGAAGMDFVDGAISGGPPHPGGHTTLYLSGSRAEELAGYEAAGLRRHVVGDRPGTASAVKMCTASVYKGTTAVWSQALETAHRLGVLEPVLADLTAALPDETAGAGRRIALAASKSGRFVAEMEQISATQGSAGVGPELFAGMAAVYERLSRTPLGSLAPEDAGALGDLTEVLDRLR